MKPQRKGNVLSRGDIRTVSIVDKTKAKTQILGMTKNGITVKPGGTLPSGLPCLVSCATCLDQGRDWDDAALVHIKAHKRRLNGNTFDVGACFAHYQKPPKEYPCYVRDVRFQGTRKSRYRSTPESELHRRTSDLFGAYLADQNDQCFGVGDSEAVHQAGAYPLSTSPARKHDGVVISKTLGPLYIEVMKTSYLDKNKADQICELPGYIFGVDIGLVCVQEAIEEDVRDWHALTIVDSEDGRFSWDSDLDRKRANTLMNSVAEYLIEQNLVTHFLTKDKLADLAEEQ